MISTWHPDETDLPRFDGDWSFGFERYRTELWGTDVVRSVGVEFISRLISEDLYVENADLDALEREARNISANTEMIASKLFDPSQPGPGGVVINDRQGSQVHNAWGGKSPAESINRYTDNLLRAIDLARTSGCGIAIG